MNKIIIKYLFNNYIKTFLKVFKIVQLDQKEKTTFLLKELKNQLI